jgi:hypothetical protein
MVGKKLYKISLCYYGENHKFFKYAFSEKIAENLAVRSLETKLRISKGYLTAYFKSRTDHKKITKE